MASGHVNRANRPNTWPQPTSCTVKKTLASREPSTHGNTHRLGIFELRNDEIRARTGDEVFLREEAYYLINPGTVGRPLTADLRATYFLFDVARHVIAVQRVAYDASASRAKSRAAGLLDRSSFLPSGIRTPIKWGAKALGVYDWMKRSGW